MRRTPTAASRADRRQKVKHLIADLRHRGVSPYTAAPPLFRLLWAMGLDVPPPLFLGFLPLTLLLGAFFGALWGGFMWLLLWRALHMPLGVAALTSACDGLAFGLCMAWYYRQKAERLRLPPWEDYPGA
jgi:hypothetical protein